MALRSFGHPFHASAFHQERNQRLAESLRVVPATQQQNDGGHIEGIAIFTHAGVLAVLSDQQSRALADAIHDTLDNK